MKVFLSLLVALCISLTTIQAQDILLLKTSGKVVIGDTSLISTPGSYNLYVQNGILTEKVKVALKTESEWSDDSFQSTPSIDAVKKSIDEKSHLVNMPSASSLVKEGYELKAMDAKLLEQIEWLWQHSIQLNEENEILRKKLAELEAEIKTSKE